MTKPSYKISCLEDHDMRHYKFVRNSQLPRDTVCNDRWWRSPDAVVFLASVVAIIVAIAWGF